MIGRFALFICLAGCLAGLVLAGCNPPAESEVTAGASLPPTPASPRLPAPVRALVDQLKDMAGRGDYRALAKLAAAQPGFRSNDGGMTPRDYWRLKVSAGDDPTKQLVQLLKEPPAIVDGVGGRSYVWPALATLRPDEVTPAIAGQIDRHLGAGQGVAFQRGAPWSGYSLAIGEDGAWLWFTAGAG